VIEACHLAGVSRIIHLSAVGASPSAPSRYLRSKAEAEALLVASGLEVTILSPSVVFGPEDNFVNLFAGLIKWMPVVPLACAHAEFQPVYVEDVARAVVLSLQRAETIGQNLPLGGPEVVRLGDLIKRIGGWMGRSPSVVPLPLPLSFLQAALMELMPVPLMTRDNVRSMLVPSVAGPIPAVLGFEPQSMALIVPNYVAVPVDAFSALRRQAAR
jgi:NADH dehydrogenase